MELLDITREDVFGNFNVTQAQTLGMRRVHILLEVNFFLSRKNSLEENERQIYNEKINTYMETDIIKDPLKNIQSHVLLREAYCNDFEAFNWFKRMEVFVFKKFLENQTSNKKIKSLIESLQSKLNYTFDNERNIYLVPFEYCKELVSRGSVALERGNAVLSQNLMVKQIANLFEISISEYFKENGSEDKNDSLGISINSTNLSSIRKQRDQFPNKKSIFSPKSLVKLSFLFNKLLSYNPKSKLYTSFQSNSTRRDVSHETVLDIEDLPNLAYNSFPPCMQATFRHLMKTGHLKHGGRMTLGLFLKDAGLPLEKSLKFWKKAFSKVMTPEQFEKAYSYNIRHNYGKEGKKTNYTSYSCAKIIAMNPNPGDVCGCPFKLYDKKNLEELLEYNGIKRSNKRNSKNSKIASTEEDENEFGTEGIRDIGGKDSYDEIFDLRNNGHYQLACGKFFDLKHGLNNQITGGINSPIEYFFESLNIKESQRENK